jgi:hypothetical protein
MQRGGAPSDTAGEPSCDRPRVGPGLRPRGLLRATASLPGEDGLAALHSATGRPRGAMIAPSLPLRRVRAGQATEGAQPPPRLVIDTGRRLPRTPRILPVRWGTSGGSPVCQRGARSVRPSDRRRSCPTQHMPRTPKRGADRCSVAERIRSARPPSTRCSGGGGSGGTTIRSGGTCAADGRPHARVGEGGHCCARGEGRGDLPTGARPDLQCRPRAGERPRAPYPRGAVRGSPDVTRADAALGGTTGGPRSARSRRGLR